MNVSEKDREMVIDTVTNTTKAVYGVTVEPVNVVISDRDLQALVDEESGRPWDQRVRIEVVMRGTSARADVSYLYPKDELLP